jgi:hypothetical protein
MSISWRPGTCADVEPGLSIAPGHRGDALIGAKAAARIWLLLAGDPAYASAVVEASPDLRGHRLLAFASRVLVAPGFIDAEIENPRPDVNARLIADVHAGRPVLATRTQIGHANAGAGVDVLVLIGTWRDEVLAPAEKQEVHTLFAKSFLDRHTGFRVRRILHETVNKPEKEFLDTSAMYRTVAEFPELGRTFHFMTREFATAMPASSGSILFSYDEPRLRLRESDQELLLAALGGSIDAELAAQLGVTLSAVKARWRSALARVEDAMPELVRDADDREGRGMQKRHRVLAYVRSHPEELRPFDWKQRRP